MTHIHLQDATLTFHVTPKGPVRLRDWMAVRLRPNKPSHIMRVEALRGINLSLTEGDRIGIIGHNGAGKSTLLKVLADVYPLTSGSRSVSGRVSSLFDIALGFELDATGWENIRYRGYLQGESRRSIRRKLSEISAFCELDRYLDVPVRYYSDGMRVRLAFSIATAIEPDILLVDEAFNAGDESFRRKARARLESIMQSARIVVAVGHEHEVLASLCDRLIWLDKGQILAMGSPEYVLAQYAQELSVSKPGGIAA